MEEIDSKKLNSEEQSELLVERFEKGIKDGFGAVLILYYIHQRKHSSSKEIRADLMQNFPESMQYNYTSFYRLLGRLRDEFSLIKEKERKKAKGPDRIYYTLTQLGETVLRKIFDRYLKPLSELKI